MVSLHQLSKEMFVPFGDNISPTFEDQRQQEGWHKRVLSDVASFCSRGVPEESILALAEYYREEGYSLEETKADLRGMIQSYHKRFGEKSYPLQISSDREVPPLIDLRADIEELKSAKLTPKVIIDGYAYADLRVVVGAGAAHKTTMMLRELIHVVLGRKIYGRDVVTPGPVAFVTAEDSRERLLARMRSMMESMFMDESEMSEVLGKFYIFDVSSDVWPLTQIDGGNIKPTELADKLIERFSDIDLSMLVFDPLVSFGASENAVNDNEQKLVAVARRLKTALDCNVTYIHHAGKVNSREGTVDQYTGRGGSALPDGSRMVVVVTSEKPNLSTNGFDPTIFSEGEELICLTVSKLTYGPSKDSFFIRRRERWRFEEVTAVKRDPKLVKEQAKAQIRNFVNSQQKRDFYYTKDSLKKCEEFKQHHNHTRAHLESLIDECVDEGSITMEMLPKDQVKGRKTYRLIAMPSTDNSYSTNLGE
ncbi:MAG: AAA family ATPase [Alphaproteobacteria bacterium]